jgi:hypothetical protein
MAVRRVHTYTHYKGKAFVAAQLRRRKQTAYMKTGRSGLTPELIKRWYEEAIEAGRKHARYMRDKYGKMILTED